MNIKPYRVGTAPESWGGDSVQTLGFVVTEDCNLRCKYCYITHKSTGKVLNFETAKKFIDYVLTTDEIIRQDAVILEFIGGEPLLEVEMIDQICDYFKLKTYEAGISWYWNYRISMSTNGVNYSDEKVQNFIKKNDGKVSVGITIDGTKEKHDLQRVFPDGSGSYDIIHKSIPLWLSQSSGDTKVTFASEDLGMLKESIIHLWNEGITRVAANVVFENVWKDGEDLILESQLKELADYIIENDLYDKYQCTFFDDTIGMPYEKEMLVQTSCGAGKMLEITPSGKIYPCMRYYDYSLNNKEGYSIGDIDHGLDKEKLRVFESVMYKYQSDAECLECPVATGCSFCQGFNYDEADTPTNFQRAKYICKMHKARVRANNYYFTKLYHQKGIKREGGFYYKRNLQFLLRNDYKPHCSYNNKNTDGYKVMSDNAVKEGLKYSERNFMRPVFLYPDECKKLLSEIEGKYDEYDILHILPASQYDAVLERKDYRLIFDESLLNREISVPYQENVFLNLSEKKLNRLSDCIKLLLDKTDRVNVNICGISREFPLEIYKAELEKAKNILIEYYNDNDLLKEINILTDRIFLKEHEPCRAGEDDLCYAPDGKVYICPAFYSENLGNVGNLTEGISIKNQQLFTQEFAPICNWCDAYQCEDCKFLNLSYTKEVNVSPSFQCKKSHIERQVSVELRNELEQCFEQEDRIEEVDYIDPIYHMIEQCKVPGCYK